MRSDEQPIGQKRTFLEEARRAQLVQCAIDAIAEVGYQRASLVEIARRAGISKAAVLYHFTSRDELINEVFHTLVRRGSAAVGPRVASETSPARQLRAYIEAMLQTMREAPAEIGVMFTIFRNHPQQRLDNLGMQQLATELIEDILRRGQATGEFGEFATRPMALTIRAAVETIPERLLDFPDLDLADYAKELLLLFGRATGAVLAE